MVDITDYKELERRKFDVNANDNTVSLRVLPLGQQPDGDVVVGKADGAIFSTTANLAANATYTSPWFDIDGFANIELFITSDVPSANKGIVIEWTNDANVATPVVRKTQYSEFREPQVRLGFLDINLRPSLDGVRIKYINGGQAQTEVLIELKGLTNPQLGTLNSAQGLVVSDFAREVALGNAPNYGQNTKFGRNPDIDSGSTPEDVWGAGGTYTGFNATGNENLTTSSDDVNDVGTLVSSGTITTNSETQVIDSTATFVTDGVAVGDIVLNDSRGTYGYVTSVDSETQLTVFKMRDGVIGTFANITGNTYRVATTGSTGAAVVEWKRILNANFESQTNVFVILNGTTDVTTTVDAYRLSRGSVLLAGSTGANEGNIACTQETTTAVVFAQIEPGNNQTLIACDTVPKDTVYLVETVQVNFGISGGSDASALITLRVRNFGGVFRIERAFEATSGGGPVNDEEIGGIVLAAGTDFKLRVESTTGNNTRVSGKIEYLEINEI